MNNSVRSMLAAAVLVGAAAVPAHAAGNDSDGEGAASATVLRAKLDVGLLDKTVHVPLETTLNHVSTKNGGGTEEETLLTAQLDGVENGKPFSLLKAKVANAEAGRKANKTWGSVKIVDAKVHLPGLPLLSVVEVEQVTARAECVAGEKPQAESNVLGTVKVLGKTVSLSAKGETVVDVKGVGKVTLDLSHTHTTSNTAAASALDLTVSVDPLELGVAKVEGEVTLAKATCESPAAADGSKETEKEAEKEAEPQTETQTVESAAPAKQEKAADETELAATGGSSTTPYVVGGAAVLIAAGGATVFALRRRGASQG